MHTLKLRNQGSLIGPLPTFDAIDPERYADMATAEIQLALGGLPDGDDLAKVRSIMAKYAGGGTTTNGGGATTLDGRAGREAGEKVRRELAHNKSIADARVKFWSDIDAEFRRAGQR